jgi:hypothetical protein
MEFLEGEREPKKISRWSRMKGFFCIAATQWTKVEEERRNKKFFQGPREKYFFL